MTITKERGEAIGDQATNQSEFTLGMYAELYGDDWDRVTGVGGFPKMGEKIADLAWKMAIDIDKKFHPNVMAGGMWMNNGFSTDKTLGDWEVVRAGTETFKEAV